MSSSNYEKNTRKEMMQVDIMLVICSLVILIPNFVWFKQLFVADLSGWYYAISAITGIVYVYFSRVCVKQVKEDETETTFARGMAIGLAVFSFCWSAGWAAYVNELVK